MNDENIALAELYKDAVVEQKKEKKRWFLVSIFSNLIWAIVFAVAIILFYVRESQFEYVGTTTETTTVYQETGEGKGNNVYQAGEHATYNEGGD